jgi:hemerythrin superfamily protein
MDAITLLKDDHQRVEKLFKRFEAAGDRAYAEKRQVVDKIIEELSVHAAIEEQLFYPVTKATVPPVEDVVLESLEEHHVVKILLAEIQHMDPQHERFDAKVTVLIENVRHHVEEEEGEYFPKVRDALGRNALGELGDAMEAAKATAPTRPHPGAPDEGPAAIVAGNAAGMVDRIRDTVSGLAQGYVNAVFAVVDRVRGTRGTRPAPTGSTRTTHLARSMRNETDELLDRTIKAVQDTKDSGEAAVQRAKVTTLATAKAASTGAKRTAGSARRGARTTKTTAKQAATTTARTAQRTARTGSPKPRTGSAAKARTRSTTKAS